MSGDRRVPKKPKAMPGIEIRERRRGGSHYQYRVRWKDPATGKRHVEIFDDPQEAVDFQAHLRLLHRRGAVSDLNRGRELLSDFATEWFNGWAAVNLTRRTLRDYAGIYNRHLLPRVGHLQLRAIKPRTVDALRSDLEEAKVGAPTIRKALAILQAMFRQAVVWDRVDANPVKPVRKPPARRVTVVVPFTVDQIEALLDHLSRNASATDRMLAELIAYSGARPEDAMAVTYERIRRTTIVYSEINVDAEIRPGAKTGENRSRAVELLSHLRKDVLAYRAAMGNPGDEALAIARQDGAPWSEQDYRTWRRYRFKPAAKAVGLPKARPYDLRHTYASMRLAEQRLSLQEIAEQMGHSVEVLARTYSHVIADIKGHGPIDPDALIAKARRKHTGAKREAD